MMPPSASTSRTRCPLAMPPTAGLHDICAIRSTFSVYSAVRRPMRAAAIAASQPACPAPTTTTSYCSVNCISFMETTPHPRAYILNDNELRGDGALPVQGGSQTRLRPTTPVIDLSPMKPVPPGVRGETEHK